MDTKRGGQFSEQNLLFHEGQDRGLSRELLEEIAKADKAIRAILIRLNQIAQDKFPEKKLATAESCAGHVKPDGALDSWVVAEGVISDYQPGIIFDTMAPTEELITYFSEIFSTAVSTTNRKFGANVISFKHRSIEGEAARRSGKTNQTAHAISFKFPILDKERAYRVLAVFWSEVENALAKIDSLSGKTMFQLEDFTHSPSFKDS